MKTDLNEILLLLHSLTKNLFTIKFPIGMIVHMSTNVFDSFRADVRRTSVVLYISVEADRCVVSLRSVFR